jgi:hypothetical protein
MTAAWSKPRERHGFLAERPTKMHGCRRRVVGAALCVLLAGIIVEAKAKADVLVVSRAIEMIPAIESDGPFIVPYVSVDECSLQDETGGSAPYLFRVSLRQDWGEHHQRGLVSSPASMMVFG